MKKLALAVILAATTVTAFAACPVGTRYNCYPGMNGKMICGCM